MAGDYYEFHGSITAGASDVDKRKQQQIDASHIPKGATIKEISRVVPKVKGTGNQVVTARLYSKSESVQVGGVMPDDPRKW